MKTLFLILIGWLYCSFNPISGPLGPGDSLQNYSHWKEREAGSIRILTYNIKNCIGMDGKIDFYRVAAVIQSINPDVVALQEVDSVTQRLNGKDVLKELAERTEMYSTYGPAIEYQGGKYGNGVLTKQKPKGYSFIPLPGRQERRSLLMVELEDFYLYATHLNNVHPGDRHGAAMIINYEVRNTDKPVILAGDFNDTPDSKTLELLSGNWVNLSGTKPTSSSVNPTKCIDYIFGLKQGNYNYKVINQVVVDEQLASDHLPVFVDVIIQ